MFKAKCPNCEYENPWERDKWWTWKPGLTWPCKKCGVMLKDDLRRSFLLLPIFVAFWLFLHHWVSHWNLLVYCLLPVGVFIFFY